MVTFACLNLVEDVYPSLATDTNAMDLIFCRNVLMYFSREQVRKVVGSFHRSLVAGGRLARQRHRGFAGAVRRSSSPASIPGVALYRKVVPGRRSYRRPRRAAVQRRAQPALRRAVGADAAPGQRALPEVRAGRCRGGTPAGQ